MPRGVGWPVVRIGFPITGGGALPPGAPTISGTVTVGGTLTITAGAGPVPTSYHLLRDGVDVGVVASGYTYVAADIAPASALGAPPSLTVVPYNASLAGPASNALAYVVPTVNLLGSWRADSASYYTLVTGKLSAALDQSGSGNTLSQGAAGNRAAIAAAGAPDGVHDCFDFALNAGAAVWVTKADVGAGTGPVTIYSVVQSPADGRYIHDGAAGDSRVFANVSGTHKIYEGGSFVAGVAAPADGTWMVVGEVFNGASSKNSIMVAGTITTATGDVGAGTTAGHTMGGRLNGAAQSLNAKLAHQLVFGAAHSDSTRIDFMTYLRGYWGVP